MTWRIFIESSLFSRLIENYLDDDQYGELQRYLIKHPTVGDIVPKSGGVRKLRWKIAGRGKRGGIRVIYYLKGKTTIYLLTVYSKGEVSNISAKVLRQIKEALTND